MNNLMQHLSLVLPVIASASVFVIIGINLYLKLRRSFPVRVNCWFCKGCTKVHYDNRNSFDCPTCLQYNGFNSDGDYNKIIPAQHDELLNNYHYSPARKATDKLITNGLCRICNNNQQLKIYQLANFVALNEEDFDAEVEAFRQHLEKAYKLCPVCERIVKDTISKQNKWLLGLKLMGSKIASLPLPDLQKKSGTIRLFSFLNASIVLFASLIIINAAYSFVSHSVIFNKVTEKYVASYVSSVVGPFQHFREILLSSDSFKVLWNVCVNFSFDDSDLIGSEYLFILVNVREQFAKYFPFHLFPNGLEVKHLFVVGLLFQIVASCSNAEKMSVKRLQIAYWMLLSATVFLQSDKYTTIINLIQIITSMGILHSSLLGTKPSAESKTSVFSTRKKSSPRKKRNASRQAFENNCGSTNSTFQSSCDTDTADSDCLSNESNCSTSTKKKTNCLNGASCNKAATHVFGQAAIFENTLMKTPISFEDLNTTRSVFNESFVTARFSGSPLYRDNSFSATLGKNFDLNQSLDNLHLSSERVPHQMRQGPTYVVNRDVTRPRPILSPPKLKTVNQNSWTAGGFWKDPQMYNVFTNTNLSRSSSQSSGYASQYNEPLHIEVNKFNSLPPSRNSSSYENHERFSLISEPAYHYPLLQAQYSDVHAPSRPSVFLNNVNGTKNNMVYRYTKLNSPVNNYPDVNLSGLAYDKFKSSGLNSARTMNHFSNSEQVRSPFHPFTTAPPPPNFEDNQNNYYKPTLTANLTGNKFCSSTNTNFGIKNGGTYKTSSLLKPLNETFCNF